MSVTSASLLRFPGTPRARVSWLRPARLSVPGQGLAMKVEGRSAVNVQATLLPQFERVMEAFKLSNPDDANVVWGYVSALRSEAKSRRIESAELHALLNGVTGGVRRG